MGGVQGEGASCGVKSGENGSGISFKGSWSPGCQDSCSRQNCWERLKKYISGRNRGEKPRIKWSHFRGEKLSKMVVIFGGNIYCWFFLHTPCNRDGRLQEADQILAINRQALDQTITHQQAIGILQKAKDSVQLVVARGSLPQLISPVVSRSPSAASTISAHSNPVSTSDSLGKWIHLFFFGSACKVVAVQVVLFYTFAD